MTIARIADDQIAEQRSDITLDDVPEHKRAHWKPIDGDPPTYDPGLQRLVGPAYVIEANRVLRQWVVQARPIDEQIGSVVEERARRMALGFDYTFPSADPRGTLHINTTPQDREFWDKVTTLAQALINGGQPTATFDIYPAMSPVTITAAEWFQIIAAWSAWEQPIILGSFWLQAQSPIPADYKTNDAYWQ